MLPPVHTNNIFFCPLVLICDNLKYYSLELVAFLIFQRFIFDLKRLKAVYCLAVPIVKHSRLVNLFF